jgi:hypothetical protein
MGRLLKFLAFTGLGAWMAVSPALYAQAGKPPETAQPAAASGRDLNGVWTVHMPEANPWINYAFRKDEPPMTPWAETRYEAAKPTFGPKAVPVERTNDPVYECLPPGIPRLYLHFLPMEIIQVPGRVLELFEFDDTMRQIWLNRTKHPADLKPTYLGDSIGHWEGNTLVVDTVGFNAKSWVDRIGHPHSEKMHLVERIRRTGPKTLLVDLTITDPVAYTKPWSGTLIFLQHPTWHIDEYACMDYAGFLKFEKPEEIQPPSK